MTTSTYTQTSSHDCEMFFDLEGRIPFGWVDDDIISKAKDRNEAISIMKRSLDEIIIDGIDTNIELHKWILDQKEFKDGIYNTNWLEKNISKFN